MTMYSIENHTEIQAPVSRVLAALTTKEGVKGWWTDDCDCNSETREATFRFAKPQGTMAVTFKLDRADETGVVMTCIREQNNADWLNTRLEFKLRGVGDKTRVDLLHSGYPAKNETYEMCTKGWAYFLASLASYVQTGTGTPYTPAAA
jgi:uncharacterized protein YndB with AHSA1/START domain